MSEKNTPKSLKEILAENLKSHRASRSLSRAKLAELTGVSETTFSAIQRGAANPKLSTLCSIADALEVNIEELFCEK